MMNQADSLKAKITGSVFDETFRRLYKEDIDRQKRRYSDAIDQFAKLFGANREIWIFSAPGRTELSGNHTDHQHGRVLAAAVMLDTLAIVSPRSDNLVNIQSAGFDLSSANLDTLKQIKSEKGSSSSLIRGIAADLHNKGFSIGGFDAYTVSSVPAGSGLSSSAAFEVLIGTIFNHLYNNGSIDAIQIAKTGQFAENVYFGKPCGLMDQTASAVGHVVAIDFLDPKSPQVTRVPCDFSALGYTLFVINAGGSHADLTDEYAAIPKEMNDVAAYFGKEHLRDIDPAIFYQKLTAMRKDLSDRAILRAMHFIEENERVADQTQALLDKNISDYLKLMQSSGDSSAMKLQNIYPSNNSRERSVLLALAICQNLLKDRGAWRVHGGGFAGTVQALVPTKSAHKFRSDVNAIFGQSNCIELFVRPDGGMMFFSGREVQS